MLSSTLSLTSAVDWDEESTCQLTAAGVFDVERKVKSLWLWVFLVRGFLHLYQVQTDI